MEQQDWILDRGRAWRDQARALRLQIQDRFRVAVDRHRDRRSHRAPTFERWIRRVRCFLRDPSGSRIDSISSRFYKKPVNKDVDKTDNTVIIRLLQALAVPVLGNACHIFMHGLNRIEIYGAEKLHEALLRRPKGKPLLTVSNHVAAIDDPFVIASLLPPSVMLDSRNIRWTLCATDRCFTNPTLSAFFRCVKVLPVSRGDGVYQKGMDMAVSKLNGGGWVHIFPEGSRSRDGGRTIRSAKRGVGRLVMDADNIPVVIPFVHAGMQEIMPVGTHFPKIGKRVTVLVGDPINFEDLLASGDDSDTQVSRGILYDNISSRINWRLRELKHQVDRLVLEQALESQDCHLSNAERANEIWQQVDWEAFGLPSGEEYTPSNKPLIPVQSSSYSDSHDRLSNSRSTIRKGFSCEGGIVSRIRGYMNPNELMGFAAKGLSFEYSNPSTNLLEVSKQISFEFQDVQPLKVWKQFLEANILQKLNM